MKLLHGEISGIKFLHREGTSDIKTFEEVIKRDVYQKRGNKIAKGDFWYDCGGNVGAFVLLAISKGAEVEVFEPDPFNCEMIEKNLQLNNFKAKLNQVALVHNDVKEATLFCGKNGNFWRNSLLKNWDKKGIKVPCVKFDHALKSGTNVKIDIEGMEMPIIESTSLKFERLIFEWSFDIDPNLERYWKVLDKLNYDYEVTCSTYKNKGVTVWPKSWFPACENVFCYAKN